MRILGIDPGSTVTGFGVVERVNGVIVHVAHGTVRPKRGAPLEQRLAQIHREVGVVAVEHAPDLAVVEKVFLAANPRSALVLGQARGAALAALASAGLEVHELAAREVKKAVVGTGTADKDQVQAMVMRLLKLESRPPTDAADALAVALCQAQMGRLIDLDVRAGRGRRRRARSLAQLGRAPR
jgi:crossover junction endodeoxyribonuclease RuvC